MGDADMLGQPAPDTLEIQQAAASVLNLIDLDIYDQINDAVQDFQDQTLREFSMQIKGYAEFRRLFLFMNSVIFPFVLIVGICYCLKELIAFQGIKIALHSAIMLASYVVATLGVPLYIGTFWAVYSFSVPDDLLEEISMFQFLLNKEGSSTTSEPVDTLKDNAESDAEFGDRVSVAQGDIVADGSKEDPENNFPETKNEENGEDSAVSDPINCFREADIQESQLPKLMAIIDSTWPKLAEQAKAMIAKSIIEEN